MGSPGPWVQLMGSRRLVSVELTFLARPPQRADVSPAHRPAQGALLPERLCGTEGNDGWSSFHGCFQETVLPGFDCGSLVWFRAGTVCVYTAPARLDSGLRKSCIMSGVCMVLSAPRESFFPSCLCESDGNSSQLDSGIY